MDAAEYAEITAAILLALKRWGRTATAILKLAGYFDVEPELRAGFDLSKTDWDKLAKASEKKNKSIWGLFWKGWGEKTYARGGERVASGLGASMRLKDKRLLADEYFSERGLQHVKQLSKTDVNSLREAIRRDIYLNEKQFAKKYADSYPCSKARLRRIKRTEAHTALENGGYNYARHLGAGWKQQVNVGDRRVRESHIAASAEGWIPIDQPFASTGRMVADDVNCRCHLIYRFTSAAGVKAGQRVGVGGTGPIPAGDT